MRSHRPLRALGLLLLSVLFSTPAAARYEDPERLKAALHAHLLGPNPQDSTTISSPTLERKLTLPRCAETPVAFDPPGSNPQASRRTVGLRCPGGWTLYVPTRIATLVEMVQLRQPVGPGQTLRAEDLTLVRQPSSSMPLGYMGSIEQAIGQISRQPLAEGTLLRPSHLRAGNAVTRGQNIRLIVQRAGMHIESTGSALADGAIGAWVKVKNPRSGRIVEGLVESAGVVRIP